MKTLAYLHMFFCQRLESNQTDKSKQPYCFLLNKYLNIHRCPVTNSLQTNHEFVCIITLSATVALREAANFKTDRTKTGTKIRSLIGLAFFFHYLLHINFSSSN